MPRLTLRVELGKGHALGPGKIRLLEAIAKAGSITQAAKALGMSYARAWHLADDLNNSFRDAAIATQPGGVDGGGATLTPFGWKLIECYRAIESDAMNATRKDLNDFEAALNGPGPPPTTKRPLRKIPR
jgi:molybdate transport system regulatory protein